MDQLLDFFRHQEGDSTLLFWSRELVVALLVFAAFWVSSRIVSRLLTVLGPRFTAFTKTDLDDRILNRISPPLSLLITAAGLYYAIRSLPLPDKAQTALGGAIFIVAVAVLTNIAWRVLDELIAWYGAALADRESSGGLDRQLLPLVEKLATIFIIATALIISLKHFNYDILSLVTALGIGSLAIGMAAKDTLAHVISGFTIMLDRPFRLGDRIQLRDGQLGDVVTIGLRSTKIRTLDNMLLIIPNSDLCNTTLINLAFPDVRIKGKIILGVAYGSDIDVVKRVLVEAALEVPEVVRNPPPEAFMKSFGDYSLEMILFFWIDDYARIIAVTDQINSRILQRFRADNIDIPFPIRTIIPHKEDA